MAGILIKIEKMILSDTVHFCVIKIGGLFNFAGSCKGSVTVLKV